MLLTLICSPLNSLGLSLLTKAEIWRKEQRKQTENYYSIKTVLDVCGLTFTLVNKCMFGDLIFQIYF